MIISQRKLFTCCLLLVISCFLVLGGGLSTQSSAQPPSVNGSLRQIGNQQVLDLWGTNYEMGYAHGYLMADKIRDLIDTFIIGVVANGNVEDYNYTLTLVTQYHTFYQQYLDEVNGMVDGMKASGKNLYVSSLRRNIDDRDIKLFNLVFEYYVSSCSAFGVWDSATANRESIVARNYDFFYDSQGNVIKDQILITYRPTDKPKFVSFGWPGWFGVASGINEHGISVMLNLGEGNLASGNGPFHPTMELVRYMLENTTPSNYLTQPLSIVNSSFELLPIIYQIGSPWAGATDPVYFVEESPSLSLARWAADTDPVYDFIIATNHFLKIPPSPSPGDSLDRYNYLRNGLISLLSSGDRKVDSSESWSLLNGVADIIAPTLTSVVIRPNRMEFDVAFAALVNGRVVTATHMEPQTYTWASLFSGESLPDLILQSIVANPASPAPGQPVTVTVTVKNQGSADSGSFRLDFYGNLALAPGAGQTGDDNCTKSGLAAGATDSCLFTIAYSTAGGYRMWAQADTGGQVAESDESNNVFGPQTIFVGSPADLVISSLTGPATVKACQTISLSDTTTNSGIFTSGTSTTKFYWSADSTYDAGDTYLGSRVIPILSPGTGSSGATSVTVACSTPPGTYYMIAAADADNSVAETDETNNYKYVALKVVMPDLVISSLTVPSTTRACQTIRVRDVTRNSGNGTSTASTTAFYWSANSTYDAGDTYLGSRAVNGLLAGGSSSAYTYLAVPCGIAKGRYYIIAVADANQAVVESNETNNTRAASISVRR